MGQLREQKEQRYRHDAGAELRLRISADQIHVGALDLRVIKQARYQVIFDCILQTADLEAHLHGLDRSSSRKTKKGPYGYVPLRFLSAEKVSEADKLLLAFDAFVFSQAVGMAPRTGRIIHGRRYTTTMVPLAGLYAKVRSAIASIAAQHASPTPPPLVLNKHCPECPFTSRCTSIAQQMDDLSLLRRMSERERKKYHAKGIFTVTQLSYGFRPRRHGNGIKHDHALKALAIRKNQLHVVGKVTFTKVGTPVYFDVEGDPARDFYYCIGLRFESIGPAIQRSYWANSPADEGTMWAECLLTLATVEGAQLIHYGSYETTFLRHMKKRYPTAEPIGLVDQLIAAAANLLSTIYGQVYFPTYSNGLKDIAQYLGFRWSEPGASGLVALHWRHEWEASGSNEFKQKLLVYNAEDCAAAQTVAEALLALTQPSSSENTNVVDVTTLKREYPQRFGKIDFVLPAFEQLNAAARWDHQRERVYIRSSKHLQRLRRKASKTTSTLFVNRVLKCEEPLPAKCDACGATTIYRFGRLSRVVHDLKLSGNGIKRWVVRHSFPRYICWSCKTTFHQYARQAKYGNTICAYAVYQIIELQLPQNVVAKSMQQLFSIRTASGVINRLKARMAEQYEVTYQSILGRIVGGALVHADETRANVAGKTAYVWVFTNLEEVAFVYSDNREASTPQELLKNFHGVLVSDFYAGYDGIDCVQQKCLIHLMRDINEDLSKQPFNDEMKLLAKHFADLLKTIVDSVDKYGLKARHLRKHRPAVDSFYATLSQHDYKTEVAAGYRKRFEKNRDRLFTFLDYDGIPWNNNNAEHAIKAFARLRNIIGGSSTAKGIREYLVLLSISETCKCKGVRFLDFLLSQQPDVDILARRR